MNRIIINERNWFSKQQVQYDPTLKLHKIKSSGGKIYPLLIMIFFGVGEERFMGDFYFII